MTDVLEPCPFCGGVAENDYQRGYRNLTSGKLGRAVAIYCCGCNADMILCREDHPEVDPEALMSELVDNWNRRSLPIASEPKDAEIPWDQRPAHPMAAWKEGLPLGLYRIHWKDEGISLAAIGMKSDGRRWIAATNWVSPCEDPMNDLWLNIERAEPIIPCEPKDAGSGEAEKLGRFGHHPDPAIDFEVEVQALGDEISNRQHGFTNGTPSWDELEKRVARALTFRVGGDNGAIEAKHALRTLASVFHLIAPSGAKP